ncbi:hypothetical protein H072_1769 [Dactylellina haptotyla CBS 200.50]|uniref:MIT domain-containing protein n=1 Tax=Dactylellina haptotyla (strain CBS 200.50) TaxID=1284197 RepID=S8BXK4_DACHA|nr:hypothetical protein H072_1769 [Dactylellina haptotyla CBS 200.50]
MSTLTEHRHHRPASSAAGSRSKAMLSSALQKANTAVLLDNANNIEGAMEAYSDACALLGHVMMRAGVDEDRRKLQQIRETYARRIEELRELSPLYRADEKELPARPPQDDSVSFESDEASMISAPASPQRVQVPPRRESLLPESINGSRGQQQQQQQHTYGTNGARTTLRRGLSHDALMEDEEYAPDVRQNYGNDFRGSPRKDARTSYAAAGRAQSPQFVQKPGFRTSIAVIAQPSVVQIDHRPKYAHKRDSSLSRITQQSQAPQMSPSRLPPTQMHTHLPPQMLPPQMPPPQIPPPQMPPPQMPPPQMMGPPSMGPPSMPPPQGPPPSLPPPSLPPQAPPPQAPPPAIPTAQQQQLRNNAARPSVIIPQKSPLPPQIIATRTPIGPPPKVLQTPSPQKHRYMGHSRDVSEASTSWLHNFDDDDGTDSPTSSFGGMSPRKAGIPVPYQNNNMYDSESEMIGADIDAAVDAAWDGFSSDADSDFEQGVVMSYGIKRLTQQPVKLMHAHSVPMLRKQSIAEEPEEEDDEDGYDANDVRRTVMLASQRLSKLGLDIDIGPSFEDSFDAVSPMTRERARHTIIARQTALLDQEMPDFDDEYMTDDTSRSHGPAPLNLDITKDIVIEDSEPTPAPRDSRRRSSNIIPVLDAAFQPLKRISAQGEVESSVDGRDGDDEDEDDEMDILDKDFNVVAQLGEFKFDLDDQGEMMPPMSETSESAPRWDEDENTLPQGDETVVMNPPPIPKNRSNQRYSGVLDRRMSGRPLSGLGPLTIETNTRQSRLLATVGTKEEKEELPATIALAPTTEEGKEPTSDASAWNASTVAVSDFSPRTIEQNLTAAKLERKRNSGTDDGSSDHTHIETLSPRTRHTLRGTGGILRQTQSHVNLKSGRMGSFPESESPGYHGLHSSASSQNLRSAKFPPRTPMSGNIASGTGLPTGGFHLFDNRIHSPTGARGGENDSSHPVPLEPMPTEQLSKTFWLMRSLNNAISNPHGGYLSKKLFVPREIWLMKGVKLKCIEEKIMASDNLTTALKKLSLVDRTDADLLLKELQDLESVMTKTEVILTKKLGSDVGASGASAMFKGTDNDGDSMGNGIDTGSGMKGSGSSSGGRSYWKKLRSKNTSSIISGSSSSYGALPSARSLESYSENINHGGGGGAGYGAGMEMENGEHPGFGGFTGPFAGYMYALSKLFEAAQVLDQLSVHIESHSIHIKTQIGLDLSINRASEFFGLVVCRFVLADVTILLDKYLKRASEWVVM